MVPDYSLFTLYYNRIKPNTPGLSEQERKLARLVLNFLASKYGVYRNAAYDQVFK